MKKRNRVTICLVAGVVILAVSAAAAFGSVNGYGRYKEALKSLTLETNNFSAQGSLVVTYGGEEVMRTTGEYAMDGANNAIHSKSWNLGRETEYFNTRLDGVGVWFNAEDNVYYQTEYGGGGDTAAENLLGVDSDDEMLNRMVNFAEIATDTVMGELKNNFVQVGTENGSTLYQVEIAKNQVPSLVNAGLSLFAYGVGESNQMDNMVTFADYSATVLARYEKITGETLPQEFRDGYLKGSSDAWYETYGDLLQKVNESNAANWEESYYKILEDNNNTGIVYVNADGSYDYYKTYKAYSAAHPEEVNQNIQSYVGQDMSLETVLCKFGVDSQGNLTSNNLEVTFQTTDQDGATHELVIQMDVTLNNYGTTVIQPLDVGGREKAS